MKQEKQLLMMYCEENIHAGAGSSTGTIDLPIQREGHTGFPKFESSTLRGAIRENIEDTLKKKTEILEFNRIFGNKENGDIASLIDFPDAKILLFPIRSFKGVFAWITCPFVMKRFKKDVYNWFGKKLEYDIHAPENQQIIVNDDSRIVYDDKVVLEEFLFNKISNKTLPLIEGKNFAKWIGENIGCEREYIEEMEMKTAIVSDDVFRDFVNLYTVRITRNKINTETGTAQDGALFNEEFLPSDSVLYSFALTSDEFKKDDYLKSSESMKYFAKKLPTLFRLGGDKGIGKGMIRQNLIKF